MGVKFGREYEEIVQDLCTAINGVDGFYEMFEMTEEMWSELDAEERKECLRTLADDVFYALGIDPVMEIGRGTIRYNKKNHVIQVSDGDRVVSVVNLI
jgi:hypothetical protein